MTTDLKTSSLAFLLVNYCGADDTIECILSIENNKYDAPIYICISDNASPTKGHEEISSFLKNKDRYISVSNSEQIVSFHKGHITVIIIKNDCNLGFGYGNNRALELLKRNYPQCDCCILLNNDTIVPNDFCGKINSYLQKQERPKIAFSTKSINYFTKEIDSEGFGYINLYTGRSSHRKRYKYSYLVGSCIAITDIPNIPFFDERFFLYYEDADYSNRLRKEKYILQYDSTNYFYHKVNSTTKQNPAIEDIKKKSMLLFMHSNFSIFVNLRFALIRVIVYLMTFKFKELSALIKYYARVS